MWDKKEEKGDDEVWVKDGLASFLFSPSLTEGFLVLVGCSLCRGKKECDKGDLSLGDADG